MIHLPCIERMMLAPSRRNETIVNVLISFRLGENHKRFIPYVFREYKGKFYVNEARLRNPERFGNVLAFDFVQTYFNQHQRHLADAD